jgi:hypothetical protein
MAPTVLFLERFVHTDISTERTRDARRGNLSGSSVQIQHAGAFTMAMGAPQANSPDFQTPKNKNSEKLSEKTCLKLRTLHEAARSQPEVSDERDLISKPVKLNLLLRSVARVTASPVYSVSQTI